MHRLVVGLKQEMHQATIRRPLQMGRCVQAITDKFDILGVFRGDHTARCVHNVHTAFSQRPYSVHTKFPQRLYSIHGASTARKQLLQRIHGAFTARKQRSHGDQSV